MKLERKLPRTSRVLATSNFYSHLGNRSHYCESMLEINALLMHEFDRTVISYTTQPFSIRYNIDGVKRRYTPDMLVKYSDNSFSSIEIKPLASFAKPKNIAKFSVLCDLFPKKLNHPLKLISCADIYTGAKIDNMKWLYSFLQQHLSQKEKDAYQKLPTSLNFGELLSLLENTTDSPHQSALRLVAHDYFNWDIEAPLSNATELTKR